MGQIDQFKNYVYSKGLCAKRILKKQLHKKMSIQTYNERNSLTSWHKVTLDGLTYHLIKLLRGHLGFFFY